MGAASATESYLLDFHHRHPGATALIVGKAALEACGQHWPSSYAWLADQVPRTDQPLALLDLACGSGEVLRQLAEREQPGLDLIGVDLSPSELAVAGAALGDRAKLIEARAQALPLPPASVDMIISHLALMLMDEVDEVVASMHRVLKPGGRIACVVWSSFVPGDGFEIFSQALRAVMAQEGVGHRIGDPRTLSAEGLTALFGQHFTSLAITDLTARQYGTPEEIWQQMVPSYDVDLLSPKGRAALHDDFLREVVPLCDRQGRLSCSFRLRALTANRE